MLFALVRKINWSKAFYIIHALFLSSCLLEDFAHPCAYAKRGYKIEMYSRVRAFNVLLRLVGYFHEMSHLIYILKCNVFEQKAISLSMYERFVYSLACKFTNDIRKGNY